MGMYVTGSVGRLDGIYTSAGLEALWMNAVSSRTTMIIPPEIARSLPAGNYTLCFTLAMGTSLRVWGLIKGLKRLVAIGSRAAIVCNKRDLIQ